MYGARTYLTLSPPISVRGIEAIANAKLAYIIALLSVSLKIAIGPKSPVNFTARQEQILI